MHADMDTSGSSGDRISTLPLEIIHIICDYPLPDHHPYAYSSSDIEPPHPLNNPILHLARTNRSLRACAQSWACSFLSKHASITGYKASSERKKQSERNFLSVQRGSLFPWLRNHCVFCGKTSARVAILMNGFRCCMACDREQWPEKITRSEAKAKFGLKDQHLPLSLKKRKGATCSGLRYGKYVSCGTVTTMYVKDDVEALAVKVHGDLNAYLSRREGQQLARVNKQKVRMAEVAVSTR